MHPEYPPASAPLEVQRVEWLPATPEAIHVHLLGRWVDHPVQESLVLLVDTERRRLPFETLDPVPEGALAAFAVPNELRGNLAFNLALQIGTHELALPGAVPGVVREAGPGTAEPEADVIDRAVLAERRARRAEVAEDALARQAAESEQTAHTLEVQLGNLEQQLQRASEERDELQAELAGARERLREAQGREHEEQRRRIEAEQAVGRTRQELEGELQAVGRRAEAANLRAEEMAREVDRSRREVALAAQAAEGRAEELRETGALIADGEEAAATVIVLEHELEERARLQERIVGQIVDMRGEIERLRAVVAEDAPESAAPAAPAAEAPPREELASRIADALEAVRAVRTEGDERAAGMRTMVGEMLATAASLREALEREGPPPAPGEAPGAPAPAPQAPGASPGYAEQLLAELQAERAARWQAEAELAQERHRSLMRELEAERAARGHLEGELLGLREELERVRDVAQEQSERRGEAQAVIADLTSAAERLRRQFVPPLDDEAPPPEAAAPAPADPGDGEILRPRTLPGVAAMPTPWLARAIALMAARRPAEAAELIAALLPVQGPRCPDELVYDLTITGGDSLRVTLIGGAAVVTTRPGAWRRGESAFHLTGTPAQLAGLAGGGTGRRRPRATSLQGSRWKLRRVLRAQRAPVSLEEVARAGAAPDPELVLRALAACVPTAWTAGQRFTVAITIEDEPPRSWTLSVEGTGVRVDAGLPPDPATAAITVPAAGVLALLGGFAAPGGEAARGSGNLPVIGLLRQWFDQVQGLA